MKPTNAEEKGCNPISSDCVIWQGPDIECISLCKGDTVSDVVFKLATELCNLIETFSLDNYDLTCLNLGDCGPDDFQALLQILIERICDCCGIDPGPNGPTVEGCPDCVVSIAPCFYYTGPQGDTITTMQLTDYVTTIGNSICTLIGQINTINLTLENHENRIEALEQAGEPDIVLPRVTPVCVVNPGIATDMDIVLAALEQQFCELIGATGSPIDLFGAVAQQCQALNEGPQLGGTGGTMANIPGWQANSNNLSSAINNIWLTICDVRAAIQNIQLNCCPTECSGVLVTMTAALLDPTSLRLYFTGTIPAGFAECAGAGTTFTITDGNGAFITSVVPVVNNMNNAAGFAIDLTGSPLNTSTNLTITASSFCLTTATGSQCQSVLNYVITSTALCPPVTVTPAQTSVAYDFSWNGGAATLIVQLWDSTQSSIIASQSTGVGGISPVSGTFLGLTGGTQYYVRLVIDINGVQTPCSYVPATTLAEPCNPATGMSANLIIT